MGVVRLKKTKKGLYTLGLLLVFVLVSAQQCTTGTNGGTKGPTTTITSIEFKENFLKVGDSLDILIKVYNSNEVSFSPKIKIVYNMNCFSGSNVKDFEFIKPNSEKNYLWTLQSSYNAKCSSFEKLEFQLIDPETDKILHETTTEIQVVSTS